MFRKKWVKVLLWILAVMLLIAGAGVWGISYVADKVLHYITASSESELAKPTATETPNPSATVLPSESPADATKPPVSEIQPSVQSLAPLQNTEQPVASTQQPTPKPPEQPAVEKTPNQEPKNDKDSDTLPYSAAISAEKAEKAQEKVTLEEKAMITSIFAKRFNADELKAFMKLASGGLSIEEKKQAKKIVLSKLTEDEYDQLIQIAAKLGLSQGKSYSESQKQFASPKP